MLLGNTDTFSHLPFLNSSMPKEKKDANMFICYYCHSLTLMYNFIIE